MKNLILVGLCLSLFALPLVAQQSEEEEISIFDARAAYKFGEYREAAKIFQRLTEKTPEDGEAWFGLGQTLLVLDDYDEAAAAFEQAAGIENEDFVSVPRRAMGSAALAHAGAGRAAEAVAWLERHVADRRPPDPALRGAEEFVGIADDPKFAALARRLWPCDVPERRQFDFWVGTWDVKGSTGSTARSEITIIQDGCAVREEYSTATGYTGTSLNFWDGADEQWHQLWVDHRGAPLRLIGGMENGSMILRSPDGRDRITWTPRGKDQVRQHWEREQDGSWTTIFDGIYTRSEVGGEAIE